MFELEHARQWRRFPPRKLDSVKEASFQEDNLFFPAKLSRVMRFFEHSHSVHVAV